MFPIAKVNVVCSLPQQHLTSDSPVGKGMPLLKPCRGGTYLGWCLSSAGWKQ